MNTAKIAEKIDELKELLECQGKLSEIDKLIIEREISTLATKIPNKVTNTHKENQRIRYKHKNIYKDKTKHGCRHWSKSKLKKALIKKANHKVRNSHIFSRKGNAFKKCFYVAWELD